MSMSGNNTSGITGVRWDNRRLQWQARIAIEGRHYVGYFDRLIDAAAARNQFILDNNLPNKLHTIELGES